MSFAHDTFVDTAGTVLSSHTSDSGGSWTLVPGHTGSAVISPSGDCRSANSVSGHALYSLSGVPPLSEYDVTATLYFASIGSFVMGPCGRVNSSNNSAYVSFYNNGNWNLYEWNNGAGTSLGFAGSSVLAGSTHVVTLQIRNSSKTLLVDGVQVIQDTTHNNIVAAGTIGIWNDSSMSDSTGVHMRSISGNILSLLSGSITVSTVGKTTASLSVSLPSSSTPPYTYQWYRSTTWGFTPGSGNIINGATSAVLSDSGLTPNVLYYYKVITTDSASASVTSPQAFLNTSPRNIVFDGNSLVYGLGSSGNGSAIGSASIGAFPDQALVLLGGQWVIANNQGVSGFTTTQMIARAAGTIDVLLSSNTISNVLVAWEIRNDIVVNGLSAAAAYTNYIQYMQARRAAGWKTVAITLTPSTHGDEPADYETRRQYINNLIRQNWQNFSDAFYDVSADNRIGFDGTSSNTTYVIDGIHLNNNGYAIVASGVASVIATAINRIPPTNLITG